MESDKRSRNWVDPSVYLSVRDADLLEDVMVLQRDRYDSNSTCIYEGAARSLWLGGKKGFSTFDYLGTQRLIAIRANLRYQVDACSC